MTTVFDLETVYKNAFYIGENNSRVSLTKQQLSIFCNILEKKVSEQKNKSLVNKFKYKYILFDFCEEEMKEFYMCHAGMFFDIDDSVVLTRPIEIEELIKVNKRYNKTINEILYDTRQVFHECLDNLELEKNNTKQLKKTM